MTTLLPPVSADRGRQITSKFSRAHVLVVGDAMLDRFLIGRVTRISPEAPVPVVAYDHETHRLGGAANVANNIAALGASATLVALSGRDEGASTLAQACREAGIAPSLVSDAERPTTTKVRIVTERNQQVARVDYESDVEISGELEQRVVSAVQQHAARASAIIVSDYLKGCITRRVVEAVVEAARATRVPVLVDPKIPHLEYYAGTTLVTPNHHEAETATHMRTRSDEEAQAAVRVFRDRARCEGVLMTRGDQGMWLFADGIEGRLPAAAREVADVTGAGDTVIATVALALAVGATPAEAARLANDAAGLVVAKFGPATLTVSELLDAVDASALAKQESPL